MSNYMMESTYQRRAHGLNNPAKYEVLTKHHKHLRGCHGFVKRFDNKEDALNYCKQSKNAWDVVELKETA